jgi:NADH-quinone oxidoreductase subunit L
MNPVQWLTGFLPPAFADDRLWLIVLFPLLGALVNALAGKRLQDRFGARAVHVVALGAMVLSAAFAVAAVVRLVGLPPEQRLLVDHLWTLLALDGLRVDFAFALDPLSAVMILVITLVGALIHLYAVGYMKGEESAWRFFAYLNLFVFSMLLLVLGDSLLLTFFGWEGVGLCSYLLIGFWYRTEENAAAGRKAFIVNRVGDVGFVAAVLLLLAGLGGAFNPDAERGEMRGTIVEVRVAQAGPWTRPRSTTQDVRLEPTLSYRELRGQLAFESRDGERPVLRNLLRAEVFGVPLMLLVGLGFLLAMAGKSAQVPLYVWLPDAMAGPTPVSALIHAATMVTAGVYLGARLSFLLVWTAEAMTVVAVVGALTALLGALFAVFQHDIKKVLAYSTVSQLGFMFLAVGVSAYGAGVFHLVTHACFKACLFLAAGSLIHAMHGALRAPAGEPAAVDLRLAPRPDDPQDLRNMGGLARALPRTRLAYLAGCLALAGLPVAAGFYSKDEILWKALSHQNVFVPGVLLYGAGVLTAGLTAFYAFRSYYLAFHGRRAGAEAHEAPRSMGVPLLVLAGASIVVGPLLGWPELWGGHPALEGFLAPVLDPAGEVSRFRWAPRVLPFSLQALAVLVALAGWAAARALYRDTARTAAALEGLRARWDRVHRVLWNQLYVDAFYRELLLSPVRDVVRAVSWVDRRVVDGAVHGVARLATGLAGAAGWFDRRVVDGAVNGVSALALAGGRRLQRLQTGRINHYVLGIALGAAALLILTWVLR